MGHARTYHIHIPYFPIRTTAPYESLANVQNKVQPNFYLAAQHVRGTDVVPLPTAVPMRYQRKIYVPLSVQV